MEQEIWKDIKWYEWSYQVSNLGRIKSLQRNGTININYIRKLVRQKNWYLYIYLRSPNKNVRVHRLVANAFIKNKRQKPYINHIDWNKENNLVENLEWVTDSENKKHSYRILWNKPYNPSKWKFWIQHHKSKRIWQYDKNWKLIYIFDWCLEVQRKLWFSQWNISSCARLERKTAYNFIWKYI